MHNSTVVFMSGRTRFVRYFCVLPILAATACSTPPSPTEDCTNDIDDDGNLLVDCRDPACSSEDACRGGDGDSDVDSDSDGDTDADGDADADGDSCERECTSPLYDHCEVGDCNTQSTEAVECCVADDITCATTLTVGEAVSDLEIAYRGFYSNDHECSVRRLESAGRETMVFEAQTRGAACEYGFIRVSVSVALDEIELGTTYDLCGNGAPPSLTVSVSSGELSSTRTYINLDCSDPGEFELDAIGDATGEPYEFRVFGALSEIDDSGQATGIEALLLIDSAGRVELVTAE
jgi:hypothetical protein